MNERDESINGGDYTSYNQDDVFVKTEPCVVEEEFPFDENVPRNDTGQRNRRLSLDEREIDHEMLAAGMKIECVRLLT